MTDVPAAPLPPLPAVPVYPISLDYSRGVEVANWRPLVNWLLAIPHLAILWALQFVVRVLFFISFFTVLFTKKNPFVGFQAMVMRYGWRTFSFVWWMRNEYPPFDFTPTAADDGVDAASVRVDEPGEMNRWLVLVKWLLLIPHYIVLALLGIAVAVVLLINFFVVLFTGRWNDGMRNFVVGVLRWYTRVDGYFLFLTDEYPPFRLEP